MSRLWFYNTFCGHRHRILGVKHLRSFPVRAKLKEQSLHVSVRRDTGSSESKAFGPQIECFGTKLNCTWSPKLNRFGIFPFGPQWPLFLQLRWSHLHDSNATCIVWKVLVRPLERCVWLISVGVLAQFYAQSLMQIIFLSFPFTSSLDKRYLTKF